MPFFEYFSWQSSSESSSIVPCEYFVWWEGQQSQLTEQPVAQWYVSAWLLRSTALWQRRWFIGSHQPEVGILVPDGMAKNFFSTWIRNIMQFFMSGSILFLPPYTLENKIIRSELESNPGPLASKATALTTRPWLLGPDKRLPFLSKQNSPIKSKQPSLSSGTCIAKYWNCSPLGV